MILATHALVGSAIARLIPSPVGGFIAAFASHFLLDAIPHWEYRLLSKRKDVENPLNNDLIMGRAFVVDLLRISFDGVLGLILPFLLFQPAHQPFDWRILIGVIGGMLPDALQFVYFKFRHEPLISLQKFHLWCHAKKRLDGHPLRGLTLQAGISIIIILALSAIH